MPKASSAYTLIEVILVMVIIGLFLGVGYANFRDFSRRQTAKNSARQLEADLRLAQELSLSGRKPTGFCTADEEGLEGIGFRLTGTRSYALYATCINNDTLVTYDSADTKTATLSDAITLQSNPATPILFKTLGRGTNLSSNTTVSVCTDVEDVGFQISPSGKISQATPICP